MAVVKALPSRTSNERSRAWRGKPGWNRGTIRPRVTEVTRGFLHPGHGTPSEEMTG